MQRSCGGKELAHSEAGMDGASIQAGEQLKLKWERGRARPGRELDFVLRIKGELCEAGEPGDLVCF